MILFTPNSRAPQPHASRTTPESYPILTPKMAELLPSSTRGHGTLEKEHAGEEGTI